MNALKAWIGRLIDVLMWVACLTGALMMIHVTIDVAGRVLFNRPLIGTIEIVSGYYMVAVAFLPLPYIARHGGHIIVELFTRNLSVRNVLRFDIFATVATFLYMCLFTWMTTRSALEKTAVGEVWEAATGYVPIWPSRWLLPAGCFVMALYLLLRLIGELRGSARPDS